MGPNMILLLCLVGAAVAVPFDDLRSDLEYMDRSTNLAEPNYRLTDSVYPNTMNVDLDVYLYEARFTGVVTIGVEVREADLTQIVLHQNVVSIDEVTIVDAAGNAVPLQFPDPFTTDSYFEILLINLAIPIATGQYTITIRYTGRINTNPVDRGFYRGYYYYGNQLRYYATTQFQPYHARKAFPCFDEPQFKSRFTISITRDSSLGQSFSNMDIQQTVVSGDRTREVFYQTPIVSAYLIAFHVSDFVATDSTSTAARPFQIISRQGPTNQHSYAADIGLRITNELDDYFGIPYYGMGQGVQMKNDHIALPDFPSGAMENWGMVNYREAYLLYDPENTNLVNQIFIATIMAHELAHKWFGNLVTCFWWSNLWLNESYASFFEYFGAHYADPSLELDEQFVIDYVQSALQADASSGATPMNWTTVANNPTITAHFSTTSYAKGASVLRTLEHFVGETTFRNALRYYLNDNAYGIGYPEDMYAGFRRAVSEDSSFATTYPGIDIGAVFDSYVQNPGSPVVYADVNMNTGRINITQQRYQVSGTPADSPLWQIPISWTHSGNFNFNTRPSFVLDTRSRIIENDPGHNFVILNNAQSGLYRVNYDDHNWEMIASYLRSDNRNNIHHLSRAQMVNDILFYIRSDDISIERAFDVLSYLRHETNYYVWAAALTQLDWIRRRLEHIPRAREEFDTFLLDSLEAVIEDLGYEGCSGCSTSTILNRAQILNYACNLGHEGCIADAVERWNAFRNTPTNLVDPNLRRHVYCNGIREGGAADYNFLFQRYNTSENTADMVVMLRTLACTRDSVSLNHYLQQTMFNDRIRIHDKTNAFQYALLGNRENVPIVLNFMYDNFRTIRTTYGGAARLNITINAVAGHLTDFEHIQQFQTWAYANQLDLEDSFPSTVSVINSAMANLEWGSSRASEIFTVVSRTNSSSAITASIILLVAALIAALLN